MTRAAVPAPGRHLRRADFDRLRTALGEWSSGPTWWTHVHKLEETCPALYIVVDHDGRIRWMGQAGGANGVAGRIRMHLTGPDRTWKQRHFDRIVVAPALDGVTRLVLERAESRAAVALDLRVDMPDRTWPARL